MSLLEKTGTIFATPVLAASLFFAPHYADAMEIKQFDQMSLNDQRKYFEAVFGESVKFLIRNGRFDESDRVLALFKGKSSGEISDGMHEFLSVLEGLRDLERKNPDKKIPHVEHAMAITLKRHGVVIAMNDMMQFAKDFRPENS